MQYNANDPHLLSSADGYNDYSNWGRRDKV